MSNSQEKEIARKEVGEAFHELYSGVEYPTISLNRVNFFVEKALDKFEWELRDKLNEARSFKKRVLEEINNACADSCQNIRRDTDICECPACDMRERILHELQL